MKKTLLYTILALAPLCAMADVAADKIYADHMVLQRGVEVPITGVCTGTEPVSVSFAGQTVEATVQNGRWTATLAPMKARNQGQTLTITQGNDTQKIKDVLVGEVWIASGQSNMLCVSTRQATPIP